MSDLLDGGGIRVPFVAARGIPQHAVVDAGSRRFVVTLVAGVADVPALRSTGVTDVLLDARAMGTARRDTVPSDAAAWASSPPVATLSPEIIRPMLAVREGSTLLGIRSAIAGVLLSFGSTAHSPLAVDLMVDDLVVTAGSLTRPGDTGARIAVRLALRTAGVARNERPHVKETDPYGQLA